MAAFQERPKQPTLQTSVLPDTRYPVSPGQATSSQPHSLPSLKPIRNSSSSSSSPDHDTLLRLSVGTQDVARTKIQRNGLPGRDSVHPGVPGFNNMSSQDIVIKSGKLVAKNAIQASDRGAPPGRNVANASPGQETVQPGGTARSSSGRDIIAGKKTQKSSAGHEILISGKRSCSSASHDILLSGTASKTTAIDRGQGQARCRSPRQSGTTLPPSDSSLRWRMSSSAVSARTDTPAPFCVPSTVSCAVSNVRSQNIRSLVRRTILSGSDPAVHGIHPGGTATTPGLQRLSISNLVAGLQSAPKKLATMPSHSIPGVLGNRSLVISASGFMQSVALVGSMLCSSVILYAQSSLPPRGSIDAAIQRQLSFAGRYLGFVRKSFSWNGLRI